MRVPKATSWFVRFMFRKTRCTSVGHRLRFEFLLCSKRSARIPNVPENRRPSYRYRSFTTHVAARSWWLERSCPSACSTCRRTVIRRASRNYSSARTAEPPRRNVSAVVEPGTKTFFRIATSFGISDEPPSRLCQFPNPTHDVPTKTNKMMLSSHSHLSITSPYM